MKDIIYEELINEGFFYIRPYFFNNNGTLIEIKTRADGENKIMNLSFISVVNKRQGYGTKTMELLTNIADKHNYSMRLIISSKFGTSKKVLRKFYKKFGFVSCSYDKDIFVREPKIK